MSSLMDIVITCLSSFFPFERPMVNLAESTNLLSSANSLHADDQ
jgi:hypothetical protein